MFVFEDFVTCDRPFCAQVRSRTMPDRSTIVMMLMMMMSCSGASLSMPDTLSHARSTLDPVRRAASAVCHVDSGGAHHGALVQMDDMPAWTTTGMDEPDVASENGSTRPPWQR